MRLNNGTETTALRYGPGGQFGEENRWVKFVNNTGSDHFIPDNSTAEQQSSYANAPVTKFKGDYGSGGYIYDNKGGFGTGPCWTPNSNSASYTNPPGCSSGFTDAGFVDGNNGNCNDYASNGGNPHGNAFHMGYYYFKYGCNGSYKHKVRIRYCRR